MSTKYKTPFINHNNNIIQSVHKSFTVTSKGTPLSVSLLAREVLAKAYPGVNTPPELGIFSLSLTIMMAACTMHSDVEP